METNVQQTALHSSGNLGSPVLIKGLITGVLILLMMIPTLFISSLVQERKGRQQEIVQEVSSRWAESQQLSGIYLQVPYEIVRTDAKGKETRTRKEFILLPETMQVESQLDPVVRKRSIYEVLLYKSTTTFSGKFKDRLPNDVQQNQVLWKEAVVCMGLSEIRGIEERVMVQIGQQNIELSPGLPSKTMLKAGLSAQVDLSASNRSDLSFTSNLRIKGSEQLHFIPLAGNSTYKMQSSWPNPSFDGNSLPSDHQISEKGFTAAWSFNKANLPFGTVLKDIDIDPNNFAFGVTMVQPAAHYTKTERSVKYAILFIGLTFSLFMVIELMQKKPIHPIQYVLIGIALSVFYTLLLSLSEFIAFDLAYLIAALATILLIGGYAQAHFKNWKTAVVFALVLLLLYSFAFILIRLEDTALLVGSIGLFAILALIMYGTRKINWYPVNPQPVL